MLIDFQLGQTGIIIRFKVRQDNTGTKPGQGFTTLTSTSSGLIVAAIADTEASTTAYTSAGSAVQTIATLGTYAAPSSNCCRLAPVDTTNHPGLMELQLANSRYAVSGAKSLTVTVSGVSGMADCDFTIPLRAVNPYSASSFMTGVNGQAPPTNWSTLAINGTGYVTYANAAPPTAAAIATAAAAAILVTPANLLATDTSGRVLLQPTQTGVTIPTVTSITNAVTANTTQFGGQAVQLDANNLPKVDAADWGGTAVGGMPNSGKVAVTLAAGDVSGNLPANLAQIAGQTASAAAAVTFPASIGTSTLTQAQVTGGAYALATNSSGQVTVGTNEDKTGYSLSASQSFNNTGQTTSLPATVEGYASGQAPPTAAAIATTILTDTNSGDLGTQGSLGYVVTHQLGGAFTSATSSVLTSTALANAPSGGATAQQIAQAVLTDTTDTTTAGSLGYLVAHAPSWYTAPDNTDVANIVASVGSALHSAVTALGSPMQANSTVVLAANGLDGITVETGENLRQAIAVIQAFLAGILTRSGNVITVQNPAGTAQRGQFTVDSSGNRSNLTVSPPA